MEAQRSVSVCGWPGVDCCSGTEGGVDQKHAVGKC